MRLKVDGRLRHTSISLHKEMAGKAIELQGMTDEVLEREEDLPKPKFSLDPLIQATNLHVGQEALYGNAGAL